MPEMLTKRASVSDTALPQQLACRVARSAGTVWRRHWGARVFDVGLPFV